MSDVVWNAIIAGVVTLTMGAMAVWLQVTLAKLSKVADATHDLVNSGYGAQLKINEISAASLYAVDSTAQNKALWDQAVEALRAHEAKQAKVDAREGREVEH